MSAAQAEPQAHQDRLLGDYLRELLGEVGEATLAQLRRHLQWVEIGAGQTLMTQGEPGATLYLTISGRLRAYLRGDDGVERVVREMGRGQVIGEMSLYTGAPRSATVVAIRDSVLVSLDKSGLQELLAASPQVSLVMTRQLIQRLQNTHGDLGQVRPVSLALIPVSDGVDAAAFAAALCQQMQTHGKVCVLDAAEIDRALQQPGLAQAPADDKAAHRRIALHLSAVEAAHDFVLLLGGTGPDPWTLRCARHADEVLLLADATRPPALHPTEQAWMQVRPGRAEATETLLLLHPPDTRCPRGTAAWLDRRPVNNHVHLRRALPRDMARLARLLSHNAVGLVLAGGGARGLAHLGVLRALQEQGVEVDWVGGTSIGGVMAAMAACDLPLERVTAVARRAFVSNPTGDLNWLPLLSLFKGRRLRRVVDVAINELLDPAVQLEDLWKNCFVVASNYSLAREQVLKRGPLIKLLLASAAIPGALPPVLLDGDILCDGGTFNNFPVDVMRQQRGVGRVIGVDLHARKPRRMEHDEVPGTWALLRDRLRPYARRRYRLPSLAAYLMNVSILYSTSRRQQARLLCDLYLQPPLDRVGMLQWQRFDTIVEQGHAYAREALALYPARPPGATASG